MIDLQPPPRAKGRLRFRVATLMAVVLVAGVVFGGLAWSVRKARNAGKASVCLCNLCAIKMALLEYHDAYGSYPPAYVADASGKPLHSWRVLILPYLSQPDLTAAYKFAEPWDGPSNRKLIDQMPCVFACPNRVVGADSLTSYVAIVGPGTAFPGAQSTTITDITDGTISTVLIGEVSNVAIPWTEPRDLDASTMSWIINDPNPGRPGFSSRDDQGPAFLFADGAYRRYLARSPQDLRALTTIHGGETVDREVRKP